MDEKIYTSSYQDFFIEENIYALSYQERFKKFIKIYRSYNVCDKKNIYHTLKICLTFVVINFLILLFQIKDTEKIYFGTGKTGLIVVFLIITAICFIASLIPILKTLLLKLNGEEIEATVLGYYNGWKKSNGEYYQNIELMMSIDNQMVYAIYNLDKTTQPYPIGSKIKIKIYKTNMLIIENE